MPITMTPSEFPPKRRDNPGRRAELRVYEALAALDLEGRCIYEFRYHERGQQVDYALWVDRSNRDAAGRYAIQVKGGIYDWGDDDRWRLRTPDGTWLSKPSPLAETVDGRIEMHDAIQKAANFYNFIGGLLILPDMPRDRELERLALNRDGVHISWDPERLHEDLARMAKQVGFKRPPTRAHAQNETQKILELQRKYQRQQPEIERRLVVPSQGVEVDSLLDQQPLIGNATFNIQHLERLTVQHIYVDRDANGTLRLPEP